MTERDGSLERAFTDGPIHAYPLSTGPAPDELPASCSRSSASRC